MDVTLFLLVNLYLLLIGNFLSRRLGLSRQETILGLTSVALAVPLAVAALLNLRAGREWWAFVLPTLLVLFLLMELFLDYWLDFDFRSTWVLGPYLVIFYVSLIGMVGYTFLIGMRYGYITLFTYFLNLAATWYSYSQVGHGVH